MTAHRTVLRSIMILLLPLCACAPGPRTSFLTLEPAPSDRILADYVGPPIQVRAVRLPAEMDRLEVVQHTAADTLNVDDFTRWGAAPGDLSRRALSADLASRLPPGAVAYPSEPASPTTLSLAVDVASLQDGPEGATLEASWTLTGRSGSVVLARRTERIVIGSAGQGSTAVAAELSQLLGELADNIAMALPAAAQAMQAHW
ncbi:MAG: PqiC family protein [Caulobacteraceae bacterium]